MSLDQAMAEIARLRAVVAERDAELARKDRQIGELAETIGELRQQVERQQHQIDALLRRLYGKKSERFDARQMMFEGLLDAAAAGNGADTAAAEPALPVAAHERRPGHGRVEIPEHLERRVIEIDIPEDRKICPKTGQPMICIGFDPSLKMEYIPGRMLVNEYRRLKYVSPADPAAGVSIPALPYFPIAKCKADTGLLAHVMVSKYDDALPLARQGRIWEREGIDISRSTLDDWTLASAEALAPLYPVLKAEMFAQCQVLGSDDTPVDLLEPGRGQARTSRMWACLGYREPEPSIVVFDFTLDRTRDGPLAFFAGYKGPIQADAYSGYDKLFAQPGIIEVGCWSHARRYFDEARTSSPIEAAEVLGEARRLFAIEEELRQAGVGPDIRLARRQAESLPIVDALFDRMAAIQLRALPQSPLGQACTYAMNQRVALMRYLDDGRLRMDNNLVEYLMRRVALGRKNWIFFGSERGGRAAAVILSLIESCRCAKINSWLYLQDVLRRIPMQPEERLVELLPHRWVPGPPVPDRIVMPVMPEMPRPVRLAQHL
jgi:transposase/uncharacterized coiled-coil protein SlyX